MFRLRKRLGSEPVSAPASAVTVVLTNWKRDRNLRAIIESLRSQTVGPALWLWNNGADFRHPAISWQVDSSVNMACWPRWWMASCARTEYVCIMDDDLQLADERVLHEMIAALADRPERTIAGLFGVRLRPDKDYRQSVHITPAADDQPVDIIKGRFMVMRTSALRFIHLRPAPPRHTLVGDDILVSGTLAEGRGGGHVLPGGFAGRWKELSNEHGLYKQHDHWAHREQARRSAFSI
jgi:hypothetical protein